MAVVTLTNGVVHIRSSSQNETLQRMHLDEFCDVRLYGNDDIHADRSKPVSHPVRAHRKVLANSESKLLRGLASEPSAGDGMLDELRFTNIDYQTLEKIVGYLHSNVQAFTADARGMKLLQSVLSGADYLGLKGLKDGAEQALILVTKTFAVKISRAPAALTRGQLLATAASMLVFAGRHACNELKNLAFRYILEDLIATNAVNVPPNTELLQLSPADAKCVIKCLPDAESQIITVTSWIAHDNSRRNHAEELLRLVSLLKLPLATLKELSQSTQLFDPGALSLINTALQHRLERKGAV